MSLIDCSANERRHDSLCHSREQQRESTDINLSLWALKECIRARASRKELNADTRYRLSNLTRILRTAIEQKDAQLAVIATVAGNATDTEHTLETLKTVSSLVAMEDAVEEIEAREVVVTLPKNANVLVPKQCDRFPTTRTGSKL